MCSANRSYFSLSIEISKISGLPDSLIRHRIGHEALLVLFVVYKEDILYSIRLYIGSLQKDSIAYNPS